MSRKNDGGPAFPVPGLQHDAEFNGMSLRDHFAGLAMCALIAEPLQPGQQGISFGIVREAVGDDAADALSAAQQLALSAYQIADAMLAERGKVRS